jgi:uncharacterized membrane protein YGL010W
VLKPQLESLFSEYAAAHRHPKNQLTHKIAIPFIVFHVIAMLDWVKLWTLTDSGYALSLGHVAFAAAGLWYLSQDLKLGLIMMVATSVCFPIANVLPWPTVVGIAVVAWIIQLIGHSVYEKNRPALLKNLVHALVGPLFFIAVLIGDWPAKQAPAASRAA